LNGADPSESDAALPPGGSIRIDHTAQVRLRAWKDGWQPSLVQSAYYVVLAPQPIDSDGDGLPDAKEIEIGSDPHNPDTNGDGIPDAAAYAAGLSVTDTDMDHDGIPNLQERAIGTDPLRADTDGDGVADGADCFPLDPTWSACVPPDPSDHTPPTIALIEPLSAVLVGTSP
jgi:hypothetical protein